MRWSHVEKRSYKYAARQYVSETHDHKPDAPTKRRVIVLPTRGLTEARQRLEAIISPQLLPVRNR